MNSNFKWPANITEDDKCAFAKEMDKKPENPFRLHLLRHAVITRRGLFHIFCIPTRLGFPGSELLGIMHWRYKRGFSKYARFVAYYLRYILSPFLATPVNRSTNQTKQVLVSDMWSDYYFHWFTDALPRLVRLLEISALKREEIEVILPANHDLTFVRKSLDILGFRHTTLERGHNHYFDRLYVPSHCGRPGLFNFPLKPTGNELRACASKFIRPSAGRRLFISRSKARCRLIVNEAEILPLLTEFGFEVVHLEDHPWEKQLEIVSQANVIMGPHGAGFTHMYCL